MTETFCFKNPQIQLNLCEKKFFVNIDQDTARICSEILIEAKERLDLLKSGSEDKLVSEEEICKFLKAGIERILHGGSVDSIFGERQQNVEDMADLMCFVVSKIRNAFGQDMESGL